MIATHCAAICAAITEAGCEVVGLFVTTQNGEDYAQASVGPRGAIRVTVATPGSHYLRRVMADVGPDGIRAWRWMNRWADDWSEESASTAAEALQRTGGVT